MRNMSVSAPRVKVRSSLPWPLRALLFIVTLAVSVAAGIGIYRYGRSIAGPDRHELSAQIERLTAQLHDVSTERDRLAAQANSDEGDLKVVRAAQDQLGQQVRSLEDENTRLKEDLAFYDSLLPVGRGDKGVVIRSFRVQPDDEPQKMRFRLLIQQSGKAERDFVGSVQLEVKCASGVQSGASTVIELPEVDAKPDRSKQFALSFRHYQRVEGTFMLPAGAVVRSVMVRVLAAGETQTQQTFPL